MNDKTASQGAGASDYVRRHSSALGLPHRISEIAFDLADRMTAAAALAGRNPLSGAAACIYMATHLMNDPRSPKAISDVVKISDSTIRSAYKDLYAVRQSLILPEWLEKGGDMSRLPKPS